MFAPKRWGIHKGTIVWYWGGRAWRRGKVVSINNYGGPFHKPRGIYVKPLNGKELVFHSLGGPEVIDAALPKPTEHPNEIRRKKELEWKNSRKY